MMTSLLLHRSISDDLRGAAEEEEEEEAAAVAEFVIREPFGELLCRLGPLFP